MGKKSANDVRRLLRQGRKVLRVPTRQAWQRRAEDLMEGHESGTLDEWLPERSVIYLWKRNLRCHNNESATAENLTYWLAKQFGPRMAV